MNMSLCFSASDPEKAEQRRRYPVGAEIIGDGASFRIWAPACEQVAIVLEETGENRLTREDEGYFSGFVKGAQAGALYRIKLNHDDRLYADPASRFQPEGPEGPSMIVDPSGFAWRDHTWPGVGRNNQVIYEMHLGTFTQEGTWRAASQHLHKLRDIGITLLEIMPINEFAGPFGWGYDGILPYAPTRLYGTPDEVREFVDQAHHLGLGVILDVVYNHFGVGDMFEHFSPDYFTTRYQNEWGRSLNFDGPNCHGVRTFFSANAAYWIDEFHFDGLRLDATQALLDDSTDHIIADISRHARKAGGARSLYLVGENEPQDGRLVRPFSQGGYGLDALWNDDFHHSAMVALTGRNEAYYHDHQGTPQEFVSAAKYGYLFQGQRYDWQNHVRGTASLDLKPSQFVHFVQNHDQVANSAKGARLSALCAPARLRAATALLLLGPQTPMLFQGQEFASSSPFFYFAQHDDEINQQVRNGREQFLKQFPSLQDGAIVKCLTDPSDPDTFVRSKLDWREFGRNIEAVALHRDLLTLRRDMRIGDCERVDGSILGPGAFLLRFFAQNPEQDRLLLVNFGADLRLRSIPDPLFAPPTCLQWHIRWSSEDPTYGGIGQRPLNLSDRWTLSADTALFLEAKHSPTSEAPDKKALHAWQAMLSH